MPQTIDQRCAQSAYEAYTKLKEELKNDKEKLEKIFGYAKKLPMMIIHSGLGNAIMFKYNKDGHNRFHKYFLNWLTGSNLNGNENQPPKEVFDKILSDATSLRYYTTKAMRWLEWFNRFADTEN